MSTLWWVRHGPTHRKDMIGWTDAPADLSDLGALDRLARFLPADAPVVSSDLLRALATADAIQHTRSRLPHDQALREIHFGAWEGVRFDALPPEDTATLRAFWESPGALRAPQGESWNDLSTRVSHVADALAQQHRHVIVVAHMGAILTQVQRARGLSAYKTLAQKIDNLSVTQLEWDGTWRDVQVNHLP
jgi:alpha-ribazole phosphatase